MGWAPNPPIWAVLCLGLGCLLVYWIWNTTEVFPGRRGAGRLIVSVVAARVAFGVAIGRWWALLLPERSPPGRPGRVPSERRA